MRPLRTGAALLLSLLLAACGGGRVPPPGAPVAAPPADAAILVGAALPPGQLMQIGGPWLSHAGVVSQVGFAAGGVLVSAGGGHVRVWEPSGALRWQSFELGSDARFAISADGARIAVAHAQIFAAGRTAIYELDGRAGPELSLGSVDALAFSPDGQRLVVANPQLTVFDLVEGRRVAMANHGALAVGFAGDDAVIAVSADGVRRWRWQSGQVELLHPFPAPPSAVALAREGEAVAWAAGSEVRFLPLGGAASGSVVTAPRPVQALALAPLGEAVAVGWEGVVAVWSTGEGARQKWSFASKSRLRPALGFSSTGQTLLASESGRLVARSAERGAYEQMSGDRTTFSDFDPSGDPVVMRGGEVWRVALASGARVAGGDELADAPAWTSDFAHGGGGVVMGWDPMATLDCQPLRTWLRGGAERTVAAPRGCEEEAGEVWFPGPGLVVAAGKPSEVWDVVKGQRLLAVPVRAARLVAASFSADRRWLVMVHLTEEQEDERGHGYAGSPDGVDDAETDEEADEEIDEEIDGDDAPDDDGDDGRSDEEREARAAAEHAGDGYDPELEPHYLVEVIALGKPRPRDQWRPARQLAWYEKAGLESVAILNDGTIFAGVEDGRVVAAAPGADELLEIGRLTSRVFLARPAPTGAVVAMTDEDERTVLFSTQAARATQGEPAATAPR